MVQEQGLTENVAQKDGSSTVSNHSSENNSYGVSQKVQVTDEATNVSGTVTRGTGDRCGKKGYCCRDWG